MSNESKSELNAAFLAPFLIETVEVFEVQASTNVSAGKVYTIDASESLTGDISGVVGIVSDHFMGSIIISFPEETFLEVMSKMLRSPQTVIDKKIIDGAGELTNMIFARAKTTLNSKGMNLKSALPGIILGKGHHFFVAKGVRRTVVPFDSDAGKFSVEILLSNESAVSEANSRRMKILVVDDSEVIRTMITNDISQMGEFEIHQAADGQIALQKIQESIEARAIFDLVFLDWNMPGLDGINVLKSVRANKLLDKCYVTMLTAEGEASNVKIAKDIGVNYYLNKPFNRKKLQIFLEHFLEVMKKI